MAAKKKKAEDTIEFDRTKDCCNRENPGQGHAPDCENSVDSEEADPAVEAAIAAVNEVAEESEKSEVSVAARIAYLEKCVATLHKSFILMANDICKTFGEPMQSRLRDDLSALEQIKF